MTLDRVRLLHIKALVVGSLRLSLLQHMWQSSFSGLCSEIVTKKKEGRVPKVGVIINLT